MNAGSSSDNGKPRLLVARGARAAEDLLLDRLAVLASATAADPALLARPVWVVVPSRSLRSHLTAELLRRRGRATAGVAIVTLRQLALTMLDAAGEQPAGGERLLPVLVQRVARGEPALAPLVGPWQDAYAAVVATVRDLLDAGFEPVHAEAIAELLAERGDGAEEQRALSLVRVAAAVVQELAALHLGTTATLLRRAAELLERDPARVLPARAVLIHGFADATGVATDLIEALLRQKRAWLVLDEPPDPADPTAADLGVEFSRRFAGRLAGVAAREDAGSPPRPTTVELFRAPGAHAEARGVARRIRALLDAGACPETVGVVARDLDPYVFALQLHFGRLGLPFSAPGTVGSRDARARRVLALAELLRRGSDTSTDVWLNATEGLATLDLRLGLHVCGAARFFDLAALDPALFLDRRDELPLPVRRGLEEVVDEDEEGGGPRRVAPRRRLDGRRLRGAVARATALAGRLAGWPERAPLSGHLARMSELLAVDLGWDEGSPAGLAVEDALASLAQDVPGEVVLDREEFLLLVRRTLAEAARAPLGGEGGGVQVLTVVEARARSFSHLFVLGTNRDSFPRAVREDPLLPDRVRSALTVLVPDIPIKRIGFDEERYLFAQLLSAAEHVTVSWQACDDDGRARPPSPLVERLRLAAGSVEPALAGDPLSATPEGEGELRPPLEHAVIAGLHGSRRQFEDALALACAESVPGLPGVAGDAAALAATRVAVLDELDPDRRTPAGRARAAHLGPYFGFLGVPFEAADPRRENPFVTTLEDIAACPWQVYLRKVLRLEPPPDAAAGLPDLSAALIGRLVHAVLQRIVIEAVGPLPTALEEALASEPRSARWPEGTVFERLLAEEALALARAEGLALPGFHRAMAERARPFLELARELEWHGGAGSVPVVGVEVRGSFSPAGEARRIGFAADRVDLTPEGVLLTDYKTGTPISGRKKPETRRANFHDQVRRGERLQAVAYVLAAGRRRAAGRYLFLPPGDWQDQQREFVVRGADADFLDAFEGAMEAVLAAWDEGAFFPRLVTPDGRSTPPRCTHCEVRDACLQGDSGARQRLLRWARRSDEAGRAGEPPARVAEAALLAVWRLAVKPEATASGGKDDR